MGRWSSDLPAKVFRDAIHVGPSTASARIWRPPFPSPFTVCLIVYSPKKKKRKKRSSQQQQQHKSGRKSNVWIFKERRVWVCRQHLKRSKDFRNPFLIYYKLSNGSVIFFFFFFFFSLLRVVVESAHPWKLVRCMHTADNTIFRLAPVEKTSQTDDPFWFLSSSSRSFSLMTHGFVFHSLDWYFLPHGHQTKKMLTHFLDNNIMTIDEKSSDGFADYEIFSFF